MIAPASPFKEMSNDLHLTPGHPKSLALEMGLGSKAWYPDGTLKIAWMLIPPNMVIYNYI